MKNKILWFLLLICCSCATFAQNKLFDKFAEMDGISSVYISKAMLQMMPDNMNMNGINISNISGKLESIQILTSEKASIAKIMREETAYIAKDKSFEELMKVKDDDSRVTFYIRRGGDKIKELVMLVDEKLDFVIIRILGDMTLKDIQNLTK